MAAQETRVALLVDGENLGSRHADFTVAAAAKRGVLAFKRVYGNAASLNGWNIAQGFRVVYVPQGKNIADLALSPDALEIALTGQADEFVIATSDRDLASVATRLAEFGFCVTGMGERAAPALRKAYRGYVPVPGPDPAPGFGRKGPDRAQNFEERMRNFLAHEGAGNDGRISFAAFGRPRARAFRINKAEARIKNSVPWIKRFLRHSQRFELDTRGARPRARVRSVPSR